MVLPLVAAAVAAPIISAGLQWMNSEEAAQATAAERKKMSDLVNQIQNPNFDFSTLTPDQYQIAAKYIPQAAKVIEQQAPQVIKGDSATAQTSKAAQLEVLQNLMQTAKNGEDPIAALAEAKANRSALSNANQQGENIDLEMQRRGLANSGIGIAARLDANARNNQLASEQGMQAEADAAQRRNAAQGQAGNLAGNIYNQDVSMEEKNAGIINAFNDALTGRRQNTEQFNVGNQNQANQFNTQNAQNVANNNTQAGNQFKQYNQTTGNDLRQKQFNNATAKVGLQNGISTGRIGDIQANTQQQNQAIAGVASGVGQGMMYAAGSPGGAPAAANPGATSLASPDYLKQNKYSGVA